VSRHYSAETLALFREGVVSSRKAARIRSHLADCGNCSDVIAGLVSVSVMVGSVQAPPMPDRLADRIQLALAGESAARLGSPATAGAPARLAGAEPVHVPGRPDLPERSGQRRRRLRMPDLSSPLLLRTLAATGAVAIIAGGGYLLASGQAGSQGAASGSGSAGSAPAAPRPSIANRNLGASQSATRTIRYRIGGKTVSATLIASHTDFTRKGMARQVRSGLASHPAPLAGATAGASTGYQAPSSIAGINMSKLAGCLTRIAAGRAILLADVAEYIGRPATIIIFAPVQHSAVYDVAVVGLACSASDSDIIATVKVPGT
jgi:hypothetical protein